MAINIPQFPANYQLLKDDGKLKTEWEYYLRSLDANIKELNSSGPDLSPYLLKSGGTMTGALVAPFIDSTNINSSNINSGDINTTGIHTDYATFSTTPYVVPSQVGTLSWNATDETLDLQVKTGTTLQIGQESYVKVLNKSGSNFLNAQVVRITGAQGNRLTAELAKADSDLNSASTIGILTEDIANNQQGFATTSGLVRDINTGSWAEGDTLYLSPTTFGAITNVKPIAPQHTVVLGWVVRSHATVGSIYVKVDNYIELEELHNVLVSSPANNQVLTYESASALWKNKDVYTSGTYTPLFISTGATFVYAVQIGNYFRIGNQVTVNFHIQLQNAGNTLTANQLYVTLPFTADSSINYSTNVKWLNTQLQVTSLGLETAISTNTAKFTQVFAATSNSTMVFPSNGLNATTGTLIAGQLIYTAQ